MTRILKALPALGWGLVLIPVAAIAGMAAYLVGSRAGITSAPAVTICLLAASEEVSRLGVIFVSRLRGRANWLIFALPVLALELTPYVIRSLGASPELVFAAFSLKLTAASLHLAASVIYGAAVISRDIRLIALALLGVTAVHCLLNWNGAALASLTAVEWLATAAALLTLCATAGWVWKTAEQQPPQTYASSG